MARNPVQFRKGIGPSAFLKFHATEDQCFDALYRGRVRSAASLIRAG